MIKKETRGGFCQLVLRIPMLGSLALTMLFGTSYCNLRVALDDCAVHLLDALITVVWVLLTVL